MADERHELLGSGRTADVLALDDARVLRRYRDGHDAAAEAAVMRHVARFGYPVPAVHVAAGTDLVLERLDGPTMLGALAAGHLDVGEAARTAARLLRDLHAVPPAGDGPCVLHLDLHPENVMLTARGAVVIDWRNAAEGPAALDDAMTAVIVAQVAVGDAGPFGGAARDWLGVLLAEPGIDPLPELDAALARRGGDPMLSRREVALLPAAAALIRDLSR